MKTIKQGLDDAYKKTGSNAYFGNGFNAGVEFATNWNDKDIEPPFGRPILLKYESGRYEVGYYLAHKYREPDFYNYPEPDIDMITSGVTQWRLINFEK